MNYNKVFLNVWVAVEFKALEIKNGIVIYFWEEVQIFYFLVDQWSEGEDRREKFPASLPDLWP